ncbi:MAG TPA: TonB-dependent receptor [Candidatus Angelobacter sp.]|nr:TonB-dependent receptor [Candidatus Angelobacter sp.]
MSIRNTGNSITRYLTAATLLFLLAIFTLPSGVFAQSTTDGAIGGVVIDPSSAVVPGAIVTTHNLGTSSTATATTDGSGRYLVGHLQPGVYSLEISAKGFAPFKATNITVEVGRVTSIDATLGVQAQVEEIVATAEAPVMVTDRADFSTNINQTTIENLPINGRRWSFFALSTPGAVPDGGFGLVSFRGISGLLNNNTVDGADNNQAFFSEERGRTRISYSSSEASIQEFQINTSNYSAEYGRAAGGVVNAVTKSGTNQIHGQAFWYLRSTDWGAINPFSFHKVLVNGVSTSVPFLPEDKRHQFGGGIGGALIKDKLFWFFSADQQLRPFPASANSGTPNAIFAPLSASETTSLTTRGVLPGNATAVVNALTLFSNLTGTVPRRGDQLILLPKIDWNINSKNHASFTYNRLRWNSPEGIQSAAVVSRGVESFGNDYVKDDWGIARLITTVSSTMTSEFRYQYGRDFEFENGQASIKGEPVSTLGFSPQISIGGVGSFTFGMPNFLNRPAFPDERRNQVADTMSWSHNTHLIKFGFDFNHVHDTDVNLFEGFGAYSYNNRVDYISDYVSATVTGAPLFCGTSSAPLNCYASFAQGFGTPGFSFATNDLAFFAQDDWRIKPRLTLNLGLRWDTEIMPSPQIPNPALPATRVFPSDRSDFGPRLGFAWDIFGNSKTIVRGGYGIFYGRIINSTIFNAIGSTGVSAGQNTISLLPGQSAAGATAPIYPNVIGTGTPPAGLSVIQFAPDTKLPLVHEFDFEVERQIATNTVLSVSYVGSLGRRLPHFVDTNLATSAPTLQTTFTVAPASGTVTSPFANDAMIGQSFTFPYFGVPGNTTTKKPSVGTGRPNTAFAAITDISNSVNSAYNALVVALNRRFYKGFQIQSSFTYSHSNDYGQASQTFTATNNVLNPLNLPGEYGRSNFDIRERFSLGAVWTPDLYKGESKALKYAVNGFTISPLINVSSGAPFTPTIFGNAPTLFVSGQGYVPPTGGSGVLAAGGTSRPPFFPNNAFQMPRTAVVDLRLQKEFKIWESWKLTLTGDAFNLFNHTNFTSVDTQMYTASSTCPAGQTCPNPTPFVNTLTFNPHFGVPTQSSNSLIAQRQVQIGAKLTF